MQRSPQRATRRQRSEFFCNGGRRDRFSENRTHRFFVVPPTLPPLSSEGGSLRPWSLGPLRADLGLVGPASSRPMIDEKLCLGRGGGLSPVFEAASGLEEKRVG